MLRRILPIVLIMMMVSTFNVSAQIAVDNTTMTVEELVQNVLLGNGVSISNVTFNGAPANEVNIQAGRYTGGSNVIEFPEALVLGTADVNNLVTGEMGGFITDSYQNDPDLMQISGFNINDGAVLEFDFIPNGDSLIFRYVFASYEYPSFTCSNYNDAFGFFISGPGINGPFSNDAINIALVPDTDIPVAINSINSGSPPNDPDCLAVNPNYMDDSIYFVDNQGAPEEETNFPGMTVTLTAYAEVICGELYHMKLGIGDAVDSSLDSGVFLEAGSFQSNSVVEVSLDVPVGVNDSTLYEGCGEAYLQFIRPNDTQGIQEVAYIEVTGTATNGVDFIPELPDSIVFAPGVDTVFFALSGVPDNEVEGQEFVNVEITNIASNCSGAVLTSDFQFYLNEADPLEVSGFDGALADCHDEIQLYPTITGGYGEYSYQWSTGEQTDTIYASPGFTSTIFVTVSDTCSVPDEQAAFEVEVPVYPPVLVDLGEDFVIEECDVTVDIVPTVSGGFGAYAYNWREEGETISTDPALVYFVENSTSIDLVVTDDCGATGMDEVMITVPPIEVTALLPDVFSAETCLDDVMLPVISEGGIGQKSYRWYVDGELQSESYSLFFMYNPAMGQNVVIEAEDECENIGTDSTVVEFNFPEVSLELSPDTAICENTPVMMRAYASGGSGGFNYAWDGIPSPSGVNVDLPRGSRSYVATVVDTCGMVAQENFNVEIRDVRADFDYQYQDYYAIQFTEYARAENPTFFWDFGDGETSDKPNPLHYFDGFDPYQVVLTVTDDIGCTDTAHYNTIPPLEIYIPNSFTPNGDGINDLFGVVAVDVYEFEMWIMDRWGKQVFHSTDIGDKWNGSNAGNEYFSGTAVYHYLIKYKGKKEEDAHEITGFVTVTR